MSRSVTGRYRFVHELVQATLYWDLRAHERARLHARIGDAIASAYPGDPSRFDELAHHFRLAAPAVGPEPGVRYAIEAAAVDEGRLAYEQASELLAHAAKLVQRLPLGPRQASQELEVLLRQALVGSLSYRYSSPEVAYAWDRAERLRCEARPVQRLAMLGGRPCSPPLVRTSTRQATWDSSS